MRPTLVIAPGAFVTDAEFWYKPLAKHLEPHGVPVRPVNLPSCGYAPPLGDLFDDAAAMGKVVDEIDGPVILGGHSYSALVATQASRGRKDKVRHLLYISGVVGDKCIMESDYVVPGEAPETEVEIRIAGRRVPLPKQLLQSAKTGGQDFAAHAVLAGSRRLLALTGVEGVIGEGRGSAAFKSNELRRLEDESLIEEGLKRVTKQSVMTFLQAPDYLAYQEIPSTYFLGLNDGEVARPQLEAQASRCTNVIEVPTNHFCHLDRPDLIAEAVARIAGEIDAADPSMAVVV